MVSLKLIAHVETRRRERGEVYSEWEEGFKKGLCEHGNREIQYIQSKKETEDSRNGAKGKVKIT